MVVERQYQLFFQFKGNQQLHIFAPISVFPGYTQIQRLYTSAALVLKKREYRTDSWSARQFLIGTVQLIIYETWRERHERKCQSLIGTVQLKKIDKKEDNIMSTD